MKTKFLLCLTLVLGATAAYSQTPPRDEIPREVLAVYYPWYSVDRSGTNGMHWGIINAAAHDAGASAHYPARGVYSSMDPDLIKSHIELAKSNGITGFIVSWWGQKSKQERNDASIPLLLKCAAQEHFKICLYWETAPGSGSERNARAVDDLAYIITQFGTNDAYLKVGGKPVIFIYERVESEIPQALWPSILAKAHTKAGPFLLIADKYEDKYARLFAGLHRYNISWALPNKTPDEIHGWAAQYYGDAVKLAWQYHRISCVTVIPGYNDTKMRKPGRNAERQDGNVYRALWEEAIKAKPDWVVIVSWNEWLEGSEIEPSVEDGDKYLKITAEYAGQFLAAKP
jgi:glycoprotein endo-alpha-1,2-mannosidase